MDHTPFPPRRTAALAWAPAIAALCGLAVLGCADPEGRSEETATAVRVQVMARREFRPTRTLLGTLEPAGRVALVSPVAGRISYPAGRAALPTGAPVRSGEVLALVESLPSRERLGEARMGRRAADDELQRAQRGVALGVLPHADLERAEIAAEAARERVRNAEAEAARLALRAPAAGALVVSRALPAGSEVAAGDALAEIALGGAPTVEAAAAAGDAAALRPGLAARLLTADGAREIGRATLREIGATLAQGALRVVFAVDGAGAAALPPPGSGVVVEVALPVRAGALAVPEEAVLTGAGGAAVLLVAPGLDRPRAVRRAVTLGAEGGGEVEVLDGLAPGDRVVVSSAAVLQPGAALVETGDKNQ